MITGKGRGAVTDEGDDKTPLLRIYCLFRRVAFVF